MQRPSDSEARRGVFRCFQSEACEAHPRLHAPQGCPRQSWAEESGCSVPPAEELALEVPVVASQNSAACLSFFFGLLLLHSVFVEAAPERKMGAMSHD